MLLNPSHLPSLLICNRHDIKGMIMPTMLPCNTRVSIWIRYINTYTYTVVCGQRHCILQGWFVDVWKGVTHWALFMFFLDHYILVHSLSHVAIMATCTLHTSSPLSKLNRTPSWIRRFCRASGARIIETGLFVSDGAVRMETAHDRLLWRTENARQTTHLEGKETIEMRPSPPCKTQAERCSPIYHNYYNITIH